jgi:hypothetical protein
MNNTFENFNWENYRNKYQDLNGLRTKEEAWYHWINYGKYENREFFYNTDDIDYFDNSDEEDSSVNEQYLYNLIDYDCDRSDDKLNKLKDKFKDLINLKHNFDWLRYINDNKDLSNIIDKQQAWYHWVLHGHRENRILHIENNVIINNTEIHNGRFGNLFFVNMVLHFISKKYNLKTTYKYYEQFENLGINLFIGNKTYKKNVYLTELNYIDLINKKKNFTNIIVTNNSWFQNYEFCLFLEIYFNKLENKNNIIKKNKFFNRYNNNNDLFVHVRLTDVEDICSHNNFEYYDNIITKYSFDNGYITSDNLNSSICQNLIQKYSLKTICLNEEETIMFGSTCNNIILSGGTFSWLIGFLAFYSKNINYPIIHKKWYGDIFIYKNWIGN